MSSKLNYVLLLALVGGAVSVTQESSSRAEPAAAWRPAGPTMNAPAAAPTMPQILDAATLAKYQAALPKVAYAQLQAIFASPNTLWYDDNAMIPSYQDTVGDGVSTPIGARANSGGKAIIVQQGQRLFSDDGTTWAFPFGHTAGTDSATNLTIARFVSLPVVNGAFLPIVYFQTNDANGPEGMGFGLHRWSWIFPKGTVIGEVLFLSDASGNLLPSEVRIRTRYLQAWAVNAYRPFISAASLASAIQSVRPGWASNASLAAVVQALGQTSTLASDSATDTQFGGLVNVSGGKDVLADFGDATLAHDLLTQTTFISAYEQPWKTNGSLSAYAASTQSTTSIVPTSYEAGLYEVNEQTCTLCHQDGARLINDFEPEAVLYGDIWGTDEIFSFHPFDQTQYSNFDNDNRAVRPEFASANIVVPYDPMVHPSSIYNALAVGDGTVVP